MITDWLYWFLIFLFFAGSFFLLHIPLPSDISDRTKLSIAEFLLRISNEYLGDLIELLFGAEVRNKATRFIISIGYVFPQHPPAEITRTNCKISGVRCITYDIADKKSDALFIFIHGGGWCTGKARYYDGIIYQLVKRMGMCAVSIDYRLAPEHEFPAGLDDCEAVVRELYYSGHDALKFNKDLIILAGDSAGGNLTAAVCQRLVKRNETFLKAQVLIYPVIHMFNFHSPSYQEYWRKYAGTALLNPRQMARWMLLYVGLPATRENLKKLMNSQHLIPEFESMKDYVNYIDTKNLPMTFRDGEAYKRRKEINNDFANSFNKIAANPEVSPLFGNTDNLPPTLVLTAGYDVLRDEGIQYYKKLKDSGNNVDWKHYSRAFHGLFNMPNSDYRLEMMQEIVDFTSKLLS